MKNSKHLLRLKNALQIYTDHDMNVYSGYATYYILLSMVPLLMLIITVINWVTPFSAEDLNGFLSRILPGLPQVQTMLTEVIRNLSSQSSGLVAWISALTALWSASNGLSAIKIGLEQINENKQNYIQGKPVALLFTVVYVILFPAIMVFQLLRQPLMNVVTRILNYLNLHGNITFFEAFMQYSSIITIVILIIVIVLTYTYLPHGKRTLKPQIPGAVLTFIVSIIFTYLFSFFMGSFWKASAIYGSLAAIFLTAMWLKFILMILFFGAAMNKAIEIEKEDL